jgi:PBSX family phage terminase large subunit
MLGRLTKKGLESIRTADQRLNFWEGAIRSTKTWVTILAWLNWIGNEAPPGEYLMIGKTERTLKRNVLDVIANLIPRDFRLVQGSGECYIYNKRIYLAGANDERAEGKIRGVTLAGAYGDELTLWPESFFFTLLGRLSVPGARFYGTTNPDSPYHWFRQKILLNETLRMRQYHFTLRDNPFLDEEYKRSIESEFVGLWRKRYIEGLWVAAEGAVYDMFDDEFLVVGDEDLPNLFRFFVACDYGTVNPAVFLLIGQGVDNCFYVIDEYRWDSTKHLGKQKTDAQYSLDLQKFYKKWKIIPEWIFVDPSAASFINQLHSDRVPNVAWADNDVLNGIRRMGSLFAAKKLKVHRRCVELLAEIYGYAWDPKAQKIGEDKPLKQGDHGPDAGRYFANGTRHIWMPWIGMKEESIIV